jgi:predicted transcriptional regulator
MRISVRLSDEMKRRLADYAKRNRLSKSEVVRRAIQRYADSLAAENAAKRRAKNNRSRA